MLVWQLVGPKVPDKSGLNFKAKHLKKSNLTCGFLVLDNFTHSIFGNTAICQYLFEIKRLLVFVSVVFNLSIDDF